jgi:DNA-binding GntR family transcriptional regulator
MESIYYRLSIIDNHSCSIFSIITHKDKLNMPERKPIRLDRDRASIANGVFQVLREAILNGDLKSGEWLRQQNLAEELGVSQTTVRDAFNQLIGEGLAVRVPYRGVRVVMLTASDLEDIYSIRAVLEGLAARIAAMHISKEELEEMQELLPYTYVSEEAASVPIAREANRKFHEIFIKASRRGYLIRNLHQLWDWIDPLMLYSRTIATEIGKETRITWGHRDQITHTHILDALKAGDAELACQVVTEAVEEAWGNLAELVFEGTDDDTNHADQKGEQTWK